MILLELQAAMAQREAECRAKDEQLVSLKQLMDGVQLELQRSSVVEKDLKVWTHTQFPSDAVQ